jgi:hypothetical protein
VQKRLMASELYDYVVALNRELEDMGERGAAAKVLHVSKFASGSTSEFYGEARLVLPKILEEVGKALPETTAARLRDVIEGIEREFALVGGS